MSEFLYRVARALVADPMVMASALAAHRAATGMTEVAQATWLQCHDPFGLAERPLHWLAGLALCCRPDPTAPSFAEEVAALAAYVGADPVRLEAVLRSAARPITDASHHGLSHGPQVGLCRQAR